MIINEGAEFSAPSRLSIKVQTVKNSNALSLCHSEERSDEESFCYRYCEDPSLSLRMTWQETGFRHRHIYALLASKPKGLLRKHFDLLRNSHSTVPVYADECELLVFGAFLNSPSACRKGFFDTLRGSGFFRSLKHFFSLKFPSVCRSRRGWDRRP